MPLNIPNLSGAAIEAATLVILDESDPAQIVNAVDGSIFPLGVASDAFGDSGEACVGLMTWQDAGTITVKCDAGFAPANHGIDFTSNAAGEAVAATTGDYVWGYTAAAATSGGYVRVRLVAPTQVLKA